jgi:hypothetical protein
VGTCPVVFYFDLSEAAASQAQAIAALEAFIEGVDADASLAGNCQEAKVVEVQPPILDESQARPLIVYPTRVQILKFV